LVPLGHALLPSGEHAEAEEHLRAALTEGQHKAPFAYALLLADTGRQQAVIPHHQAAARQEGEVHAHLNLALIHDDLHEEDERAAQWYVSAVEHGDPQALVEYADFLQRCDRPAEIPGLPTQCPNIELTASQQTDPALLAGAGENRA
jgi:TPR repeat protein